MTDREPDSPILDMEMLDTVIQLGVTRPGFVQSILQQFEEDTRQRLDRMRLAGEDDRETVWQQAHALKSSAGHLGAVRMWAIAEGIERVGRDGHELVQERVASLAEAFEEALRAIHEALDAALQS